MATGISGTADGKGLDEFFNADDASGLSYSAAPAAAAPVGASAAPGGSYGVADPGLRSYGSPPMQGPAVVDPMQQQQLQAQPTDYGIPKHPFAMFFQVVFKVLALGAYLLLAFFSVQFTAVCIVVLLLLAADFWVVKNVTGRLLVGLRYWNEVREDGTSHWVYESYEKQRRMNMSEVIYFWATMLVTPLLWALFALSQLLSYNVLLPLKPQWFIIDIVAIALTVINLIGYVKCARESRNQLRNIAVGYVAPKAATWAANQVLTQLAKGPQQQQPAAAPASP